MIDKETQAFLEPFQSAQDGLEHQPLEEARANYRELFASGAPKRPPVVVRNIVCPATSRPIPCRLYEPALPASSPRPVLIYMHGGGGVLGDVESYDDLMAWISFHCDLAVVFPEYCLAPEYPFPSAINECHQVVNWVADLAANWNLSRERLLLAGDSTGGSIATACSIRSREEGAATIAGQCLIYPQLDMRADHSYPSRKEFADGKYFLGEGGIQWSRSHYLSREADSLSPLATVFCDEELWRTPPTAIFTAGLDPLRDEGAAYSEALKSAGVQVDYLCLDTAIHGCVSFSGLLPTGKKALDWLSASLQSLAR